MNPRLRGKISTKPKVARLSNYFIEKLVEINVNYLNSHKFKIGYSIPYIQSTSIASLD